MAANLFWFWHQSWKFSHWTQLRLDARSSSSTWSQRPFRQIDPAQKSLFELIWGDLYSELFRQTVSQGQSEWLRKLRLCAHSGAQTPTSSYLSVHVKIRWTNLSLESRNFSIIHIFSPCPGTISPFPYFSVWGHCKQMSSMGRSLFLCLPTPMPSWPGGVIICKIPEMRIFGAYLDRMPAAPMSDLHLSGGFWDKLWSSWE